MLTIVGGWIDCSVLDLKTKISIVMSEILNDFGKAVKLYRKAKGLSQEKLADKCGLHRTYIGMIERAEKNITLVNIEKISKALNVSIADLFKYSADGNYD